MPTQEKVQQVAEITEKLQNMAGVWFIDARGLTVKETAASVRLAVPCMSTRTSWPASL